MKARLALPVALLGSLVCWAARAPAQERPAPDFATQAEAITVDVVVLDKDGHPVSDLTRGDFTVLDDGRPQVLVGFEARALTRAAGAESEVRADSVTATNEGAPHGRRAFAFILDDLGTEPLHMTDGVKAVTSWLEHSADPRDEVTLLTTSGEGWWSDSVGRGRDDLIAVLASVRGKKASQDAVDSMSEWEAYRIDAFEGGGVNPDVPDAQGVAALTVSPPNAQCIRPHASSANDLAGRVVDRWMATKACQCEPATGDTILESRQSCRTQVSGVARAQHRATLQRAQAMLGAIERLSRGLAGSSGRKSILVLSDGLVRDTQLERFDAAVDATQRGNVAVSFIDLRGLAGSAAYHADQKAVPKEGDLASVDLEQSLLEGAGTEYVAAATGGSTIRDTNDLLGGLTRVAEEASAYYLLGYQPDKPRDGKHHKLEVKVSRPGVTVRARRGYVASVAPQAVAADRAGPAPQAGKGPKRPLDPALMAGAFDDAIPLRIAPYVLEPDGPGLARVRVAVEIDTSKISLDGAAGTGHASLDLTLLGASRGKGKLVPLDERLRFDVAEKSAGGWLTLSRDLHLPEGVAMVRALVREVATGRAGSVAQRFEVPPLNAPYLTTPVLTDRAQTPAHGFPQLLPVAHRRFRPASLLYCQYGVEGLGDSQGRATLRVMGGHTLQLAGGPVVTIAPPTMIAMGIEGELVRTFTLPLEGLAPGDYRLVIDVVDETSSRSLSAVEVFSVEGAARLSGE
jgi:VWFA-related protein